jgi:hypothetical protein
MKPTSKKPRPLNYAAQMERRKRMAKELVAPAKDWTIEVTRELRLGPWIYPRGSAIADIAALGNNASKLFASGAVRWCPPSSAQRPQRRPLQPPAAQPVRPPVMIIEASNALESWYLTRDAYRRLCPNNALAEEWLLQDPQVRQLYLVAQQLACEAERARLEKTGIARRSVSPSELSRPL